MKWSGAWLEQPGCLLAAYHDGIGFLAQIIVGRERHFGMAGTSHMTKVESVRLLVISMRQPLGVGDDFGGALRHRSTLPSGPPAGKQPACSRPSSRPPPPIAKGMNALRQGDFKAAPRHSNGR